MMVFRFAIPSMRHTSVKKPKVDYFMLCARSLLGGPYYKTYCAVNAVAVSCVVVVRMNTTPERFKKRLVLTNITVLPWSDSISRPRMSILTYFNGSMAGNGFSSRTCYQSSEPLQAQEMKCFTAFCATTSIGGHQEFRRR